MRYSRKMKTRINMNVGKDIKVKKSLLLINKKNKTPAVELLCYIYLVYSENWKNLLVRRSQL